MASSENLETTDDSHVAALGERLLKGDFRELSAREQRVIAHIARHQPATRSVNYVVEEGSTWGERLADSVARFGGSWTFIVLFVAGLAAWIIVNTVMFSRYRATFDAYPYIFLNLILSMVAALQAPVILMSQNRQANRDRVAASLDYEVNLKAELEIMTLHDKLDGLRIDRLEQMLDAQHDKLDRLVTQVCGGRDAATDGS